jgi:transposase
LLFERFAIDVLLETDVLGASKILGITWDEAHHLMRRAVKRGLIRRSKKVPRYMGVDEKSIARGHRYATLVTDLDRGTVIEVAEDRKMTSLMMCLGGFTMKELRRVDAVAMDMWEPYVQSLRTLMPGAGEKIVFDRFHIIGHMNEAVDLVRRRESRALRLDGNNRLVGSKHLWLYGIENLPGRYEEQFSHLRKANLKTARAWAIKEMLRSLWKRPSEEAGRRWWKRWDSWATRSRLAPVRRVAEMLKRHLPNVLSYFRHRITNSTSEALNSVIQMIKKRAFGYRSFDNFRTAILFRCGGLDLYPQTHPKVG